MSPTLIVLDTETASKKALSPKLLWITVVVNVPFHISSHSIELYDQQP